MWTLSTCITLKCLVHTKWQLFPWTLCILKCAAANFYSVHVFQTQCNMIFEMKTVISHPQADRFSDEGESQQLAESSVYRRWFQHWSNGYAEAFNDLGGSPLLGHLLGSISSPGWALPLVRQSHKGALSISFVFTRPSGSPPVPHGVSVRSANPAERPLWLREPLCIRPLCVCVCFPLC